MGRMVGLRQLTPDDVTDRYLAWMRDSEVIGFLESRFLEHTEQSLREYVVGTGGRSDTALLAIIELERGRHVGNIKIGPLNRHHGTADVGLLIGEREFQGRGYGAEAIRLASRYAFEVMDVRKLTASCYSANVASAAAFRRAGWTEECRRPAQYLGDDGREQDQVVFGLLRTSLRSASQT
jgi:RimJ/RimL family protein N-acetyltransferase